MKRTFFVFFALCILLFLWACGKKDYSVRFKNEYKEGIYNITAGNAYLGRADTGKTTAYQKFTGSSFIIAGTSDSGIQVNGSERVSGKGTHKWTITLTKAGKINFVQDL